jgi:Holliday junction resolvase RusA-like endonuclease
MTLNPVSPVVRVLRQVKFFVIGQPVPKSRPRVVTKGKRRFAYTPKRVKEWENHIKEKAEKHFERPYDGPVVVSIVFLMPRPKSRRLDYWVSTTPDLDNLEKSVLDAMNEVAYTDDRLVVVKSSSKRYVQGEEPGVRVVVTAITDQRSLTEYDK